MWKYRSFFYEQVSESAPDEAAAIYSTLTTIENLIEIKPAVAGLVCGKTKLMKWSVSKIKSWEFDGNKQYVWPFMAGTEPESSPVKWKKPDNSVKLPERYEILDKFFGSLDSSICLLRIKVSAATYSNIMNQKKFPSKLWCILKVQNTGIHNTMKAALIMS